MKIQFLFVVSFILFATLHAAAEGKQETVEWNDITITPESSIIVLDSTESETYLSLSDVYKIVREKKSGDVVLYFRGMSNSLRLDLGSINSKQKFNELLTHFGNSKN